MKSQKLKPQDIKAGDRIIAISKSGKTRAIVEVKYKGTVGVDTEDEISMFYKDYDFFICPPAFTIVPNMMENSLKRKWMIQISNISPWVIAGYPNNDITTDYISNDTIIPIPDEPIYREITIAEIEKLVGCKVKIMENGK